MKKFHQLFFIIFLLSFAGCTSKDALNYFEESGVNAAAIQQTKKADLVYKDEIKALVFATYLNKTDNKYKNSNVDTFLLGLHIVNEDKHDLENSAYKVLLNKKEAKKLEALDNKSDLVQSIPLKNSWANYYVISFDSKKENKDLVLNLTHEVFGQVQLNFQK